MSSSSTLQPFSSGPNAQTDLSHHYISPNRRNAQRSPCRQHVPVEVRLQLLRKRTRPLRERQAAALNCLSHALVQRLSNHRQFVLLVRRFSKALERRRLHYSLAEGHAGVRGFDLDLGVPEQGGGSWILMAATEDFMIKTQSATHQPNNQHRNTTRREEGRACVCLHEAEVVHDAVHVELARAHYHVLPTLLHLQLTVSGRAGLGEVRGTLVRSSG